MMGKSIRIFLVDGEAKGLMTAEIGQWTGKALVVPRSKLSELTDRPEGRRAGVYVLIGPDAERPSIDRVYIGEAEEVLPRLRQHVQSKEFWTRAAIFCASDENLTKAHIKYLESRLVEIGIAAARSVMDNGNTPPRPKLPEAEVSDMEHFLEQMRILLPVLGMNFAQPSAAKQVHERPDDASPTFEIKAVGARATAREIDGEFVVLQGSTARVEGVQSWTTGKATRDRLLEEGILIPSNDPSLYSFATDCTFTSPSLAGSVVSGRNTNGRIEWKRVDTGDSYADWQESSLDTEASKVSDVLA